MVHLYGDLTEARCQEDTLRLLQRVINMSVEVLKLYLEAERTHQEAQLDKELLLKKVEHIESFRNAVQKTIDAEAATRAHDDVVGLLANAISDLLTQQVKGSAAQIAAKVEDRIRESKAKYDLLANQAFAVLKNFFMSSGVPATRGTLQCGLNELEYRARSEIVDASGITCSYSLNTGRSDFFSAPRRFGDLVAGKLEVPIGTKRVWLKKQPAPETIRIEDAVLTNLVDGDDSAEFRLGPRPSYGVDGLLVRVSKSGPDDLQVFRLDVAGKASPIPPELFSRVHLDALFRFWKKLSPSVLALYNARENLLSLSVEGKDVVEGRLYNDVVLRLVQYLAPLIKEVQVHSTNAEELCLKVEREEGRRDEFFVRKKTLLDRLAELPDSLRNLFAPLGLGPALGSLPSGPSHIGKKMPM